MRGKENMLHSFTEPAFNGNLTNRNISTKVTTHGALGSARPGFSPQACHFLFQLPEFQFLQINESRLP